MDIWQQLQYHTKAQQSILGSATVLEAVACVKGSGGRELGCVHGWQRWWPEVMGFVRVGVGGRKVVIWGWRVGVGRGWAAGVGSGGRSVGVHSGCVESRGLTKGASKWRLEVGGGVLESGVGSGWAVGVCSGCAKGEWEGGHNLGV